MVIASDLVIKADRPQLTIKVAVKVGGCKSGRKTKPGVEMKFVQ